MIYYVNASAAAPGDGTKENPFSTIQSAADLALPGDEVIVLPGIYREDVSPKHAGRPDARITYRSSSPLAAVITGAMPVGNWTSEGGGVWTVRVSNTVFGDFNPYTSLVSGDWFNGLLTQHLGDVFLNDRSMYEVQDPEKVRHPEVSLASWNPDFSVYTWACRQDAQTNETVFLANFHEKDPNEENVEITVRPHCFYPKEEQIGYITFSGFTVCKACPQWAPPTAYQEGMIGPHWSKGWIIEDCEIYEAKCSGISLGKYLQPENDNKWLKWKYKDGTQTERDCIMQAVNEGWSKEAVGSHIVRRCNIHDCGQTGIVGHLGGAFSVIEENHIHHINNKQNLAGAEIGGIKMHAAIDCTFRKNHIHHCTRGIWLDWQAQGTRVTQNFMHHNTLPNLQEKAARMSEDKQPLINGGMYSDANSKHPLVKEEMCSDVNTKHPLVKEEMCSDANTKHPLVKEEMCSDANSKKSLIKERMQYTAEEKNSLLSGLGEDIFVEVSHGPTLIDNNLLLSTRAIKFAAQGGAFVHNLIGGSIVSVGIGTDNGVPDIPSPRYTPYHVPHETLVAGFMTFLHGDVRFYNNAFVSQPVHPLLREEEASHAGIKNMWDDRCATVGTHVYDGYETFEEWNHSFDGYCGHGSKTTDRYYKHLPVWMHGNAYFNGARVWEKEEDAYVDNEHTIRLDVRETEPGSNDWQLSTNLREFLPVVSEEFVSTETLGMAFEPEQRFEAPDGTDILFDISCDGEKRNGSIKAGPFA